MQRDKVIRLASQYARRHGYSVQAYEVTLKRNGREWQISFRSKAAKPDPGDFFTVYMDDRSGQVTNFAPGK